MEKINANHLSKFLKKIYLNSMIENCKITTYKNGDFLVEAIDEKTSVLLACQTNLGTKDEWDLGVGDFSTLIKFLSAVGNNEIKIGKKDNKLTLKSKNKGNLNYLLKDIDFISTIMEIEDDKSPIDSILELIKFEIKLSKKDKESFVSLMKILNLEIVNLKVVNGEVQFQAGSESEHSFELPIGEIDSKENFEIPVDGNALLNVLSVADDEVNILFQKDIPLVIKESDDYIYAINIVDSNE